MSLLGCAVSNRFPAEQQLSVEQASWGRGDGPWWDCQSKCWRRASGARWREFGRRSGLAAGLPFRSGAKVSTTNVTCSAPEKSEPTVGVTIAKSRNSAVSLVKDALHRRLAVSRILGLTQAMTGFSANLLRGQTIGLLGGSFDPPHRGHVSITLEAMKRFQLDQVWWLVSPGNPLKSEGPAALERRMAASRAIMQHPRRQDQRLRGRGRHAIYRRDIAGADAALSRCSVRVADGRRQPVSVSSLGKTGSGSWKTSRSGFWRDPVRGFLRDCRWRRTDMSGSGCAVGRRRCWRGQSRRRGALSTCR